MLDDDTRRAYASRVRGYLIWLDGADVDGDPLTQVRFRWTGPIPGVGREPGKLTGARLVREANGWHVVLRTQVVMPDPQPHCGPMVGVDRGVKVALAMSDGNDHKHGPWMATKEQERLLRLQRSAARKRRAHKRGAPVSHRLSRTYDQIAKLRARAKCRRSDWQHQITTALAERYGVVVVEELKIANMVRRPKPKPDHAAGHKKLQLVPGVAAEV